METENQRTIQQNKALHLLFTQIAEALNDAGLDLRKVLTANDVDVPWNSSLVKEILWRQIQETQCGKRSTTELTTKEIDEVFDTLNRFLAKMGIQVDFPSVEAILNKMRNE